METSAKNGINTQKLFVEAAKILYKDFVNYGPNLEEMDDNITIENQKSKDDRTASVCCK